LRRELAQMIANGLGRARRLGGAASRGAARVGDRTTEYVTRRACGNFIEARLVKAATK
jgi:hypothetical protein